MSEIKFNINKLIKSHYNSFFYKTILDKLTARENLPSGTLN